MFQGVKTYGRNALGIEFEQRYELINRTGSPYAPFHPMVGQQIYSVKARRGNNCPSEIEIAYQSKQTTVPSLQSPIVWSASPISESDTEEESKPWNLKSMVGGILGWGDEEGEESQSERSQSERSQSEWSQSESSQSEWPGDKPYRARSEYRPTSPRPVSSQTSKDTLSKILASTDNFVRTERYLTIKGKKYKQKL